MLAKLTLRLALAPEQGWPRFAVAHQAAGSLPTPLQHVAMVGFTSALATGLGWVTRPGATSGGVVLHTLVAVIGYAGGALLAVVGSAQLLRAHAPRDVIERFASGAILPVILCGCVNVVPFPLLSFVLALAGAAASAHSGWIGASALLALEGQPRKWAAIVPAGLAVSAVLVATFARMALPK